LAPVNCKIKHSFEIEDNTYPVVLINTSPSMDQAFNSRTNSLKIVTLWITYFWKHVKLPFHIYLTSKLIESKVKFYAICSLILYLWPKLDLTFYQVILMKMWLDRFFDVMSLTMWYTCNMFKGLFTIYYVNYGFKIQMWKRLWTVADIFAPPVFHEDGGRHFRSQWTVATNIECIWFLVSMEFSHSCLISIYR